MCLLHNWRRIEGAVVRFGAEMSFDLRFGGFETIDESLGALVSILL